MRAPRPLLGGLIGALAATILTGCSEPAFHYVRSSEYNTVFRVPSEWSEIQQEDLEASIFGSESAAAAMAAERSWVAGFDASGDPDVAHLFGTDASAPNLYAVVRELDATTQGSLSLDGMRDLLLPVSATARERAAAESAAAAPTGFELLADETIAQDDGMRGVHVVYNYDLGGSLQTFDQTVLVDQATSRVHVLLVRCSAQCYRDRSDELEAVATSFTVKD